MKKITTLALSCSILLIAACDNKETKDTNEKIFEVSKDSTVTETVQSGVSTEGNGTYTAEGKTYTGKVKAETDNLKFFTVTCEGDMVQQIEFHFKNEEAARKGGSFKAGSLTPIENNEVGIMFGIGYKSAKVMEGTITVTGSGGKNTIEFNNVKLTIPDKSILVSGTILF